MKTVTIPQDYHHIAPDGAEIRELLENQHAGIAQGFLPTGVVSKTFRHKTVSEFWYVLSGKGKIWRKDNQEEQITELVPGVTIDIPQGTAFQYRSDEDLTFIIVTMPPWPGADEAVEIDTGKWQSSN